MRFSDIIMAAATQGGGAAAASYTPEAEALFARMSPAPDTARKTIINNLIVALLSGATSGTNIWAKIDVLYVLAADVSANALLDWKNLGGSAAFNATVVGTPTFTADRGYTNNATTSYLSTNYNPTANGSQFTQDGAHLMAWNRTSAAATNTSIKTGISVAPGVGIISRTSGDETRGVINDATAADPVANASGDGFYMICRPDASTKRYFKNNAQLGTDISRASTGLTNGTIRIGGATTGGNFQWAASSAGANLTVAEALDYYNAVQTYMTAVGA